MIYAKITLNGGGIYTQPIGELNILIDEIKEAIDNDALDSEWKIELVEMPEEEYNKIPVFLGH